MKPLGHKAYGHIPHFEGSRMTPADKKCSPGHQKIMTEKARDYKDLIIVQEKLDGSNCAVAKINNKIIPLTRAGYVANTSPYIMHHYFYDWVMVNEIRFDNLLRDSERIVGEWMIQAHGTRYRIDYEPFIVFDIMTKHNRLIYHEFLKRVVYYDFEIPRLIHMGQSLKLKHAKKAIETSGHGAIDRVEGFVYRCEREWKVEFLCKWVHPDKVDGKYLNGNNPVWNVDIKNYQSMP